MKNEAFIRGCKGTLLVTALIVLTTSLSLLLAGSVISTMIPNLVTNPAYAVEEFDIDINVEDNDIERGDTQHITVTVRNDDTNDRVSDAEVRLTVDPPDSDSSSATDETDNDGQARFDVKIDDDAETGTYDVEIRVSKDGYDTKTVSTSFDVIRGDDDDRDSDRDGDKRSVTVSAAAAASSSSSDLGNAVGTGSGDAGGSSNRGPSGAAGASVSSP
ncbi:MAG TPA: MG2 domain-containing protein [Nitrososphaeraceae archaeon]|nr:MG2 domain-containing protein [Nitrososphaeraceae archaeon]